PLAKYAWGVVQSIAFSPEGGILANTAPDNTVDLWDTRTRHRVATIQGHVKAVLSVAFSARGEMVATGSEDGTVKIRRIRRGLKFGEELLFTLAGKYRVDVVAFSGDGRTLAIGSQYESLRFWDAQSNKLGPGLKGACASVKAAAFSPDGKTLATACNEGFKLWDLATRAPLPVPEELLQGTSVAFSPDGLLLGIGARGDVKLWDRRTPGGVLVFK